MQYFTAGKKYNAGKIVNIQCFKNGGLKEIDIKDKCFLLIALTDGSLKFERNGEIIYAASPAFICFNEEYNPRLISKRKAKFHAVYFHPDFLNVNMSFERIRSDSYGEIAETHDMFLLKPFLDNCFTVPICETCIEKIETACENMADELKQQRDWYWSCRGRSYFLEIIILLERMYGISEHTEKKNDKNSTFSLDNARLRSAMLFIESNYSRPLTLKEISVAAELNHTTLTRLFKEKTGMTAIDYLFFYRVNAAKKMLEFTSIPIKDIAERTGFKTVQHFNRVFTQYIGEPPAGFRKSAVQKRKDGIK